MNTYLGKKAALSRRRSLVKATGTRAAAAVWKYNRNTEELTMYWLSDGDSKLAYRDVKGVLRILMRLLSENLGLPQNAF